MIYSGSCHCKAVQFEFEAPEQLEVDRCNCSICLKAGILHAIVPNRNFTLLTGEESLEVYTFNTGVAKHYFCKICGIKPFYTPRSNPDGCSVNANCLDPVPHNMVITDFDGVNWEQNAASLAHKSK